MQWVALPENKASGKTEPPRPPDFFFWDGKSKDEPSFREPLQSLHRSVPSKDRRKIAGHTGDTWQSRKEVTHTAHNTDKTIGPNWWSNTHKILFFFKENNCPGQRWILWVYPLSNVLLLGHGHAANWVWHCIHRPLHFLDCNRVPQQDRRRLLGPATWKGLVYPKHPEESSLKFWGLRKL